MQGNQRDWVQCARGMQEGREMPDECKGVFNVPGQCREMQGHM